jgi:hypothetical protein
MSDDRMNPFPGLRPFETEESHLFFGREEAVDQLLERLTRVRLVTVFGTSGSGKSSLIRAGLLPALLSGMSPLVGNAPRVGIMRPGYDPIHNLAQALTAAGRSEEGKVQDAVTQAEVILSRSNLGLVSYVEQFFGSTENVLVVVDQFEELFRFARYSAGTDYADKARAFIKLLLTASQTSDASVYIVISMRSDFLGDSTRFAGLPEAIDHGQYLIPRLTREQYRQAIVGPLYSRTSISQRLVNRLLNDVGDNADQLPIFQHSLMRTWDHWAQHQASPVIDIDDYQAIGGMENALSLHADEAFAELSESKQQIASRLFKSLTEKGTDNRELRRPTSLRELQELTEASKADLISVIEVFRREGRSLLMPPASVQIDDETIIDVCHESLIRNWRRLREWVEEEAQSSRIYSRLSDSAKLYQQGHAGLLQNLEIQTVLKWREANQPNEAWARRLDGNLRNVMDFLDRSVRTMKTRRRMEILRVRTFSVVLLLLLVLIIGLGIYAREQRNIAVVERRDAQFHKDMEMQARYEAERQRMIAEAAQREIANLTAAQAAQLKAKKSR